MYIMNIDYIMKVLNEGICMKQIIYIDDFFVGGFSDK